jgi:6-pyruvoyltetrahydropterin/6-carboxytetrahydropterin synthase
MTTTIRKEVEFDTGHRVPDHKSKCRNPHGHRYRVRATCEGSIVDDAGSSDHGMLVDFGDLKAWLTEHIHDVLDHGFMVYEHDEPMRQALEGHDWRVIVVPFIPTAENLARWCWQQLAPVIDSHWRGNLRLTLIEVWETPTGVATYTDHPHPAAGHYAAGGQR